MSIKMPMAQLRSWISMIPQILIIGILMIIFYLLGFEDYFTFGIITFLILFLLLRNLVAIYHRKAIGLIKKQKFEEAVPIFEKSVQFFTKHSLVDKLRYITLLSSSKLSYREMGLCNIAFCYGQIGNGKKSKECYEEILKEYPENGMAISALNMLDSMK
jgi:tetratricopeptide (TPR) repeat protein